MLLKENISWDVSEVLKEVKFEERLNEEEKPAMRKTMKTKQQRQELIWIIHMMKIIVVCLQKSAGANPWNALKARVRSLEVRKTRHSKFSGKLLEIYKLGAS